MEEFIKTVAIRPDQQEFVKNSTMNFSKFVRKMLDEEMKKNKEE